MLEQQIKSAAGYTDSNQITVNVTVGLCAIIGDFFKF